MTELRETVESYWTAAEARHWLAFGDTLAEDVLFDLPQTRERIRGKARFVQFNCEYPGDWHIRVHRLIVDEKSGQVVTWSHATVGFEQKYAITFFTADAEGRIATITEFWPEPYEPPPGREHLVERY